MLRLINADPMQFAAVCDTCGHREAPLPGTREEALARLNELAWRVDERFTKSTVCAKCAGPPSVFGKARVIADPNRCSECMAEVGNCEACGAAFVVDEPMSCRRTHGHAHARCATQKIRRFTPPGL